MAGEFTGGVMALLRWNGRFRQVWDLTGRIGAMIVAPQGECRGRYCNSAIAGALGLSCSAATRHAPLCCRAKEPAVANPSYAAYTWSPIGADLPIPGTSFPSKSERL